MKQTLFTLLLGLLYSLITLQSVAQDQSGYRPVLIYYNAELQLTKPELAAYKRVAYLPDSLKNIHPINAPKFNGPVRDYYSNGVLWAMGSYNNGVLWGEWRFYYPNGQLDCKGIYDGIWPTGLWEFWWPNGQPLMVAEYNKADMRLISFWNENGEQTVKDGNGIYTSITLNDQNVKMKMEGPYENGYQSGTWTYGPVGGEILAEQTFKEKGKVLRGVSYEKKKKKVYTFENRFKVKPEPDHLVTVDFWKADQAAYAQDYPVLAEAMGFEVIKVPYERKSKYTKDYYYKIIQRFETGADTVSYGVPVEPAKFKGDFQTYLNKNLHFPSGLANERLEGTIVVQFSISTEGKVENPSISKSLHPMLDAEVLRVFKSMPNWEPATVDGKPLVMSTMSVIKVTKGNRFFQEESSSRQF